MNKFFNFIKKIIPDKSDVFLLSGIGSIFWGVYQLSTPISFVVLGILLTTVGILNSFPIKKA